MEYDINKIRSLCDRYFDAETTAEEELVLREYFALTEHVPEDLKAVKVMMGGFSQAAAMTYRLTARPKARVRRIVWGMVAAAASVAICVGLMNRETYGYDIDGRAITDPVAALEGVSYLTHLEKLETTIDIAEMLANGMEDND